MKFQHSPDDEEDVELKNELIKMLSQGVKEAIQEASKYPLQKEEQSSSAEQRHFLELNNESANSQQQIIQRLVEALKALLKFNEDLCEDFQFSKHYPSAEKARAALEAAKPFLKKISSIG